MGKVFKGYLALFYTYLGSTPIPVWTIISLQHQGADDSELLENYPSLTPFDLVAVRNYYCVHQQEIDDIIANYAEEDELDLC